MKVFLKHSKNGKIVFRSIKVALVVGTILALINHYDVLINRTFTTTNIIQILLTYLVPYMVATYGSASQARYLELEERKQNVNMKK